MKISRQPLLCFPLYTLYLFNLLFQIMYAFFGIFDCTALFGKEFFRAVTKVFIVNLSDFRIVLFNDFLAGSNLALQAGNFAISFALSTTT